MTLESLREDMHRLTEDEKSGLEIELKFELSASDVRTLCRAPALKALMVAPPRTKTLRATYFDTPDNLLAARELSLRVRKESRRHVQCLKAMAPSAPSAPSARCENITGFARLEWEWPVPGPCLDYSLLRDDADIMALLEGIDFSQLCAVYSTDIKRQSRELRTPGGALIQCEIDQGRVLAGTPEAPLEAPVRELELELTSGDEAELLATATLITSLVPARLSARTKAQRGQVLASGRGHEWVKAQMPKLAKGASAEEVLRTSVMSGLKHLMANEDCVLTRGHIEGVHQMRVALRRIRSVITTYKKLLPEGSFEHLSQGLKEAGSALSNARDWDVFLDEVLTNVENGFDQDPALAVMRKRALGKQEQAYRAVEGLIHSEDYAKLLTQTLVWVASSAWRRAERDGEETDTLQIPATKVAQHILSKRHKNVLKAGKGLKSLTVEQRHRLRITLKKARYAAEFFAEIYPDKKTKPYLKPLKILQESLGHLNDLAAAERLMGELIADGGDGADLHRASGMVEGWFMHAQHTREKDLQKGWKAFCAAKTFW